MRRLGVVLCLVVLAACSSSAEGGESTVEMGESQRFAPSPLRVKEGTTVTFVNGSSQAHTVTAYDDGIPDGADYFASGDFESEADARDALADGIIGQEGTFEVTFDVAGTYEYFCIPHEEQGMVGTVIVEAG